MEPLSLHDLTAAYALDALDAEQARTYEAHLGGCERCRDELAALGETAADLAWGVEAPLPPARLRAAIIGQAALERQNVAPLPVTRSRLFRAVAAAAAVAACAVVGLAVWVGLLSHSLDRQRSENRAAVGAAAVLADPSARRLSLPGRRGEVAVASGGRAVLVVHDLARPPAGKTYEAWVIPAGSRPLPAGLFAGGPTTVLRLGERVPRGATIAATVERAGGVSAPTGAAVFSVRT